MNKLQFYIFWLKNRNKQFRDTMSVQAYCLVKNDFKISYDNYLKLSNNEFKNFRINKLSWLDWRLTT